MPEILELPRMRMESLSILIPPSEIFPKWPLLMNSESMFAWSIMTGSEIWNIELVRNANCYTFTFSMIKNMFSRFIPLSEIQRMEVKVPVITKRRSFSNKTFEARLTRKPDTTCTWPTLTLMLPLLLLRNAIHQWTR